MEMKKITKNGDVPEMEKFDTESDKIGAFSNFTGISLQCFEWLGSVMVRALNLLSAGCEFDSCGAM